MLADLVNDDDVLVLTAGGGPGLGQEPVDVLDPLLGEQLDGHEAVELVVPGQVDLSHPAASELANELVAGHSRPWRQGGRDRALGRLVVEGDGPPLMEAMPAVLHHETHARAGGCQ